MTWARSQIAIAKRRSAATTGAAFGEHRRQGERSVLVVLSRTNVSSRGIDTY